MGEFILDAHSKLTHLRICSIIQYAILKHKHHIIIELSARFVDIRIEFSLNLLHQYTFIVPKSIGFFTIS